MCCRRCSRRFQCFILQRRERLDTTQIFAKGQNCCLKSFTSKFYFWLGNSTCLLLEKHRLCEWWQCGLEARKTLLDLTTTDVIVSPTAHVVTASQSTIPIEPAKLYNNATNVQSSALRTTRLSKLATAARPSTSSNWTWKLTQTPEQSNAVS